MIDLRNLGILGITLGLVALSFLLTWKYLVGFICGILWMIFMMWFQKETVLMMSKLYTIQKRLKVDKKDSGKIIRRKLRR